jgi:hypothetical protein
MCIYNEQTISAAPFVVMIRLEAGIVSDGLELDVTFLISHTNIKGNQYPALKSALASLFPLWSLHY